MKDRIKKIRKESTEKTLEKFGAKIGISAAALSQIENGKTEASKQTINTICDKFGVMKFGFELVKETHILKCQKMI